MYVVRSPGNSRRRREMPGDRLRVMSHVSFVSGHFPSAAGYARRRTCNMCRPDTYNSTWITSHTYRRALRKQVWYCSRSLLKKTQIQHWTCALVWCTYNRDPTYFFIVHYNIVVHATCCGIKIPPFSQSLITFINPVSSHKLDSLVLCMTLTQLLLPISSKIFFRQWCFLIFLEMVVGIITTFLVVQ